MNRKDLDLQHCYPFSDYECWVENSRLNLSLRLRDLEKARSLVSFLNEHPEIKRLEIDNCGLDDEFADFLSTAKYLRIININYNGKITNNGILDICKNKNLEILYFSQGNKEISDFCKQVIRARLQNRRHNKVLNYYLFIHGIFDNRSSLSLLSTCMDIVKIISYNFISLDYRLIASNKPTLNASSITLFNKACNQNSNIHINNIITDNMNNKPVLEITDDNNNNQTIYIDNGLNSTTEKSELDNDKNSKKLSTYNNSVVTFQPIHRNLEDEDLYKKSDCKTGCVIF